MHLLDAKTRQLKYFVGRNIPPYAILSHTWGDGEVSMHDLLHDPHVESKQGFAKIHATCKQALNDALEWVWVDTCCIDQSSSAELSEAINSMFDWYLRSQICYALLADISKHGDHYCVWTSADTHSETSLEGFMESRWFTRGWTLQELIAPRKLNFFDRHWSCLGARQDFPIIRQRTGIPLSLFRLNSELSDVRDHLDSFSIATRMSWASQRQTTRPEDTAYCLLGLMGVNMPLLYGEGERAFLRLQEEVIATSTDQSIFAWSSDQWSPASEILAPSPACFKDAAGIAPSNSQVTSRFRPYQLTHAGLRISGPCIDSPRDFGLTHFVLNCHRDGMPVVLLLREIQRPGQLQQRMPWRYERFERKSRIIAPRAVRFAKYRDMLIMKHCTAEHSVYRPAWLYLRMYDEDPTAGLDVVDAQPRQLWAFNPTLSRETLYADENSENIIIARLHGKEGGTAVRVAGVLTVTWHDQTVDIHIDYEGDSFVPMISRPHEYEAREVGRITLAPSQHHPERHHLEGIPRRLLPLPQAASLVLRSGAVMSATLDMDDVVDDRVPALEIRVRDPPPARKSPGHATACEQSTGPADASSDELELEELKTSCRWRCQAGAADAKPTWRALLSMTMSRLLRSRNDRSRRSANTNVTCDCLCHLGAQCY
ncbi:HET-domain-containing protein [Teratosphaeria nubilosa]|uniref:HET-domain-containing protein n=1 Tax=Teratosphaeria nubilosa TaxID=161662 RepID=A0A6G1KZU6_9PEZI|nr:HET-domain-containing protein [Teratosphaeria nubilosa]